MILDVPWITRNRRTHKMGSVITTTTGGAGGAGQVTQPGGQAQAGGAGQVTLPNTATEPTPSVPAAIAVLAIATIGIRRPLRRAP